MGKEILMFGILKLKKINFTATRLIKDVDIDIEDFFW